MTETVRRFALVLSGLLVLVLVVLPYFRGLFFDPDFYLFHAIFYFLFGIVVFFFMRNRWEAVPSLFLRFLWVWLLPIAYLVAMYGAASKLRAWESVLRWTDNALLFTVVLLITVLYRRTRHLFALGGFITAAWVAVFGLLAFGGVVQFRDAVLGQRLASVFQYPNTLAAFLAGFALFGLVLLLDRLMRWVRYGVAMLLPVLLTAFYLTLSRGGYLVFAAVWFGLLFMLRAVSNQVRYLVYSAFAIGVSLVFVRDVLSLQGQGWKILWPLLAQAAIMLLLVVGYDRLETLATRKLPRKGVWSRWLIPVGLGAGGCVLAWGVWSSQTVQAWLPEPIRARLAQIDLGQFSVVERTGFFKDALNVFMDHWFVGAGGGAWEVLFHRYQSFPYYSKEIHNFYLQLLVEVGLLGTVIILGFILWTLWLGWRRLKALDDREALWQVAVFGVIAVFLLHSVLDFNMTYGAFHLWLFVFLALFVTRAVDRVGQEGSRQKEDSWPTPSDLLRYTLNTVAGVLIVGAVFTGRTAYAYHQVQSLASQEDGSVLYQELDSLVRKVPFDASLRLKRLDVLVQLVQKPGYEGLRQQIVEEAQRIEDLEPYDPNVLLRLTNVYAQIGDGMRALEMSRRAYENGPWYIQAYEGYAEMLTIYGRYLLEKGQFKQAKEQFNRVIAFRDEVEKRLAEFERLPDVLVNTRQFGMTPKLRLLIAEAMYHMGQFDRIPTWVQPLYDDKKPETAAKARVWGALALEKVNNHVAAQQLLEQGKQKGLPIDNVRNEVNAQLAAARAPSGN